MGASCSQEIRPWLGLIVIESAGVIPISQQPPPAGTIFLPCSCDAMFKVLPGVFQYNIMWPAYLVFSLCWIAERLLVSQYTTAEPRYNEVVHAAKNFIKSRISLIWGFKFSVEKNHYKIPRTFLTHIILSVIAYKQILSIVAWLWAPVQAVQIVPRAIQRRGSWRLRLSCHVAEQKILDSMAYHA